MSTPNRNRRNSHNHNDANNNRSWMPILLKTGTAGVILSGAYYYYKNFMKPNEEKEQNDNQTDNDVSFPLYNPTPLGADFDDTDDTNHGTTFYTANGSVGDGKKMGVREEYIATLLQQRRTLSVLCNPYLNHHKIEHYFHFGLNSSSPILSHFNRIKFVIIVRSKSDVLLVAKRILSEFPQFIEEKNDTKLPKPIGSTDRFYMIQIASILIVSSGIGAASISILLQEITKMLVDAGAFQPNESNASLNYQTSYVEYILLMSAPGIKTSPSAKVYKRRKSLSNIMDVGDINNQSLARSRSQTGPSTPRSAAASSRFGGLSSMKVDLKAEREKSKALAAQSKSSQNVFEKDKRPSQETQGEVPVIIPTSCYNEKLSTYRDFECCGQNIGRQMKFDRNLISDIKIRCSFLRSLKPRMGKGISVQYFNEAFSYNSVVINQDSNIKSKFIQNCIDLNIKYVDMESGYLAAFCNKLNISSVAIVGIEYDIAAPSKGGNNMRVSHDLAMQATMDVFCQYLWDRISQESEVQRVKTMQQGMNGLNEDEQSENDMDNVSISSLKKASSCSTPITNTKSVLITKHNVSDDSAPPAFGGNGQIVSFDVNGNNNNNSLNHDEGSQEFVDL